MIGSLTRCARRLGFTAVLGLFLAAALGAPDAGLSAPGAESQAPFAAATERAGASAGPAGASAGRAGASAGRAGASAGRAGADAGAVSYAAPVEPLRVVRAFVPPPTPYAAGHRGVDLAVAARAVVRSAADGQVTFASSVAGRGVVVVRHSDGVSTEYEPVQSQVRVGAAVARGQPLGRVSGRHGSCPPDRCLHWGARRDGGYLDPLGLLRPLGPVRLLPWT